MDKYNVHISFVLQAPDRKIAWTMARVICETKLRNLAIVNSVSTKPLPNPDEWIAINEPIKARS